MLKQKVDTGARIGSMVVDHFSMTLIMGILIIPFFIPSIIDGFNVSHENQSDPFDTYDSYFSFIFYAISSFYFCKDSFSGRSLAKRIFKLQIIEKKTGKVASPIQCLFRNLFIIIWPIEVIVTLINPNRRIGDMITGTEVVPYSAENHPSQINYGFIAISFLIATGFLYIIFSPFESLNNSFIEQNTFVKESYNENTSKKLEQSLIKGVESFAFSPDIRVYDSVPYMENSKYISVIFHLNQNYLDDDTTFDMLDSSTRKIIRSSLEDEKYVGKIQYSYKNTGTFKTITKYLSEPKIE
ncbi:RDD family protein [Aureivirga marina]|uniref:RDD family protein n=1 Tax=Aureivirga marina TaxID=1182451 RepID=UPI0018CAF6B9|nr:RDD family protein [Aureivirga marina]